MIKFFWLILLCAILWLAGIFFLPLQFDALEKILGTSGFNESIRGIPQKIRGVASSADEARLKVLKDSKEQIETAKETAKQLQEQSEVKIKQTKQVIEQIESTVDATQNAIQQAEKLKQSVSNLTEFSGALTQSGNESR